MVTGTAETRSAKSLPLTPLKEINLPIGPLLAIVDDVEKADPGRNSALDQGIAFFKAALKGHELTELGQFPEPNSTSNAAKQAFEQIERVIRSNRELAATLQTAQEEPTVDHQAKLLAVSCCQALTDLRDQKSPEQTDLERLKSLLATRQRILSSPLNIPICCPV